MSRRISATKASGQRLKQVRIKLGLTGAGFGERLGFAPSHISGMEKGNYGIETQTCIILSEICRVNLDWLETGEGEMFLPARDPLLDLPAELLGPLDTARYILKSGNEGASRALRENLDYFRRAVDAERKAENLETQTHELKGIVSDLIVRMGLVEDRLDSSQNPTGSGSQGD